MTGRSIAARPRGHQSERLHQIKINPRQFQICASLSQVVQAKADSQTIVEARHSEGIRHRFLALPAADPSAQWIWTKVEGLDIDIAIHSIDQSATQQNPWAADPVSTRTQAG